MNFPILMAPKSISKFLSFTPLFLFGATLVASLTACSSGAGGTTTGNPVVADTSATGAVASAVGGALSNSSANGVTMVAESQASTHPMSQKNATESSASVLCPTYASIAGSGCTENSSASIWLTYNSCHFPSSPTALDGFEVLTMAPTSGTATAACGTFPDPTLNNATAGALIRQYVHSSMSSTPDNLIRTDSDGKMYSIDNASANLSNFNSDTLPTIANGGYGAKVMFSSTGVRTSITIGHHINAVAFEHSVYGTLTISEASNVATSRSVSGNVTVYHDRLKVIGNSVFTNVIHSNTCCLPISGSITTTFSGTANTPIGSAVAGKAEKLEFTGCGTGTLTGTDGSVTTVSMNRCF